MPMLLPIVVQFEVFLVLQVAVVLKAMLTAIVTTFSMVAASKAIGLIVVLLTLNTIDDSV